MREGKRKILAFNLLFNHGSRINLNPNGSRVNLNPQPMPLKVTLAWSGGPTKGSVQ